MSEQTGRTQEKPQGWRRVSRFIVNVLLFLASPFIALSYLVALPVVGFFQFSRSLLESRQKKNSGDTSRAGKT
ncbi:MAG: hypothetical protein PVI83_09895 [Lysobacterales bacterium]